MTWTALLITSAGRLWPFGVRGILTAKHSISLDAGPRRRRLFSANSTEGHPVPIKRLWFVLLVTAGILESGMALAHFGLQDRMELVAGLRKSAGSPRLGALRSEFLVGGASPGRQRLGALRRQAGARCWRLRAAVCFSSRSVLADTWRLRRRCPHAVTSTASVDSMADGGIPVDNHRPSLDTPLRQSGCDEEFKRLSLSAGRSTGLRHYRGRTALFHHGADRGPDAERLRAAAPGRRPRAERRERRRLFITICPAVSHAHQHGGIHRETEAGAAEVAFRS